MSQLRSKFRGTLLGVAIGDALGAPFEGTDVVAPEALADLGWRDDLLRYTDDTHMTLGVAESLVAVRGFDGRHLAETFVRHFVAEPWRGYGAGPPQVFALLRQGVAWNEAAQTLFGGRGSFGNGAAMRVAPVALLAFKDLERVKHLAEQSARITHTHPLGIEGAVLQACAIALLLKLALLLQPAPHALVRDLVLAELRCHVQSSMYRDRLAHVEVLLAGAAPDEVVAQLGHGIAAYEAVPAAFYAFLRHPESFPAAIRCAIGLGGDTDTIASMVGALSGAYLGEEGLPAAWRGRIEGAHRLQHLADALLVLATAEGP